MTNKMRDNGWAESYESSTIASPNVLGLIQAPFLSKYGYYTGGDGKLHQSSVYAGKDYNDDNYPFDFASRYANNAALANPYWILQNGDGDNKNHQEVTQFILNINPKWQITKNLVISNRFSYILNRTNERYYLPECGIPQYNLEGLGDVTSMSKSLFSKETSIYEDFRIDWKNNYGAHDIEVFGGFRLTSNSFDDSYMTGYNGGNDKMPDIVSSLSYRSLTGTNDKWKNLNYYLHANYGFMNKYFVDATLSAEASSRFGKDTEEGIKMFGVKWGIFPSLQLGWVITNEPWMKTGNIVNYLKLTAGYEESGNDNIDYSASRTYFKATPFLKTAIGLKLVNIENPALQWETTRKWDLGLNGSFFNNRLQAGAEVFIHNTDNLLTQKTVNYATGLNSYWCNGGKLRNVGVEANANIILVTNKDFTWQIGATMGHYKNKITALPGNDYTTKVYGAEILTSVNNPAGLFYGYKTDGVFASDNEAKNATANGYLKYPTGIENDPYRYFKAGDVKFIDNDNNGIIDDNDKTVIGDPNPDIYGNIYTNLTYKRWALDINFKYSVGNDIYNYQRSQLENLNSFYNQTAAAVNRWSNENQQTSIPRAMTADSEEWVNNERFSDRWIEDGSYLKLKKVRLSYTLPLNLSWIQGLTIWGETNNLFSIDKYTGSDPEFSCGNSVLYQGIDAGLLPSNRNFILGVRINL
jgi:TonB-linked SusC/RagA family outer membrane protein